ncbi:MAG: prolyl oligopeptidase family serine peptidase [Phycisphaerales bacterium]
MIERFARFPAALAERARAERLGGDIPALLAHPDWERTAPVAIWLHGRTVSKELDPGRYLRWIRAGIAACAIDLPGHGERGEEFHSPARTMDLLEQLIPEIDRVVEALAGPRFGGVFDLDRMALGGMSAGGMAALRRLCDEHPFACAAVEGTTGSLDDLYFSKETSPRTVARHDPGRVARLDPLRHVSGWRPIPLLVVHSEADGVVPFAGMRRFVGALREHYRGRGADPGMVELLTWPETGAPEEHMGFGRYSNDAKNAQTEFLRRHLG